MPQMHRVCRPFYYIVWYFLLSESHPLLLWTFSITVILQFQQSSHCLQKIPNQIIEIKILGQLSSRGSQMLSYFISREPSRADSLPVCSTSFADHLCPPPHSSFNHIAKWINEKLPFGITQCHSKCLCRREGRGKGIGGKWNWMTDQPCQRDQNQEVID